MAGDIETAESAEPAAAFLDEPPPFRWWQFAPVVLLVVLCDLTIFRGKGYAGYASLFLGAPLLMAAAAAGRRIGREAVPVAVMLLLLALRLAWFGSAWQLALGFALLVAFAMTLAGRRPYVLEGLGFASQTVAAGYIAIHRQWRACRDTSPTLSAGGFLAFGLPLAAFVAFGLLFVLANPDLAAALGERVERIAVSVREWLLNFTPDVVEFLFWGAALWIVVGLLRPLTNGSELVETFRDEDDGEHEDGESSPLYAPFRNSLVTVILLFAGYLAFEYQTLWFREFPEGFYYSGYAHQGAFWLTVALGLTTLTLSLVFRGSILDDPRRPILRKLAWLWSAENLLLAAAVYHRMLIYVGFNGMTRMRVVGFCGISAVVVGFLLVLVKIAASRDFVWLIRRQLWALFLFVFVYAVAPVDALVMRYNVERILSGDPTPSVQISVHPIDPDGLLQLPPLLESDDPIVREGVRALLAEKLTEARSRRKQQAEDGWTGYQWGDAVLVRELESLEDRLSPYDSRAARTRALRRFHDYAYQWY